MKKECFEIKYIITEMKILVESLKNKVYESLRVEQEDKEMENVR